MLNAGSPPVLAEVKIDSPVASLDVAAIAVLLIRNAVAKLTS